MRFPRWGGNGRGFLNVLRGVCLLLAAIPAFAQAYTIRVFGADEGLGNLAVQSVIQDRRGYLWAGTLNGLYRYNGERFEHFGIAEGLPDSAVISLAATPDGNVWAGSARGVALFRGGRFQKVSFGERFKVGEAIGIGYPSGLGVEPRTGALWIATSRGLARIKPEAMQDTVPNVHFVPELPPVSVNCVGFGAAGAVWFSDSSQLYRWTSHGMWKPGAEAGVPKDQWQAILADRDGNMWVRSITRLLMLKPGSRKFTSESGGLPKAELGALGLDPDGRIAVPTVLGLARKSWRALANHRAGQWPANQLGLLHHGGPRRFALDRNKWWRGCSLAWLRRLGGLDDSNVAG